MTISLRSGRDLIHIPFKKSQEVQAELVPKQAEEMQSTTKDAKILGKSEYQRTKKAKWV